MSAIVGGLLIALLFILAAAAAVYPATREHETRDGMRPPDPPTEFPW